VPLPLFDAGSSSTAGSSCVSSLMQSESEWELEAAAVDRSVRVLPVVKALLASIPDRRYAVATSRMKTYGALPTPSLPGISVATELIGEK